MGSARSGRAIKCMFKVRKDRLQLKQSAYLCQVCTRPSVHELCFCLCTLQESASKGMPVTLFGPTWRVVKNLCYGFLPALWQKKQTASWLSPLLHYPKKKTKVSLWAHMNTFIYIYIQRTCKGKPFFSSFHMCQSSITFCHKHELSCVPPGDEKPGHASRNIRHSKQHKTNMLEKVSAPLRKSIH